MSLRHIFLEEPPPHQGIIVLTGSLRHRLCNVLRVRPGEKLVLRGPDGSAVLAHPVAMDREHLRLEVVMPVEPPVAPPRHVTIVQAVAKGDHFDQVLQHGTELGVSAFLPLITRRTVWRLPASGTENALARWRRVVLSAAEQAQRESVPTVHPPASLVQALNMTSPIATRCFLHPGSPTALSEVASRGNRGDIALFLGPEGGFSEDELSLFHERRVIGASLGPYILRAETAALTAAVLVLWSSPAV